MILYLYLNDILVFLKTKEEHNCILVDMLVIIDAKLYAKPLKC